MSCKFFSISTYEYIWNTCLHYIDELELVLCHPMLWLLHDERIRHNSLSPIHCLRAFHILFFAYLLFRCYCYNHYKIPKTLLLLSLLLLLLPPVSYYFATKHFAADTKFPGVVELTTQLLILENILWLPLCRINKFGLNTLPSKTVAIPYTCGLSLRGLEIEQGCC